MCYPCLTPLYVGCRATTGLEPAVDNVSVEPEPGLHDGLLQAGCTQQEKQKVVQQNDKKNNHKLYFSIVSFSLQL